MEKKNNKKTHNCWGAPRAREEKKASSERRCATEAVNLVVLHRRKKRHKKLDVFRESGRRFVSRARGLREGGGVVRCSSRVLNVPHADEFATGLEEQTAAGRD
ncbi:hypothetical protein HPB50_002599 [Hyalomma asiaticum]|uniref:Uncharacterized protein n=1 Tax=Hyalomma asiaticum TaxID=266040 RepID=A0ACB7SFX2_HYAAI|nr:hypothetical protein HPB50_002599 [Hyalomma asiaticum]